jgi:hypothetical protein
MEAYPGRMALKSDENIFHSPTRNDPMGPRRIQSGSLTPPPRARKDMKEDWRKRKYGDFAGLSPFERSSFEPELKRWQQDIGRSHNNNHAGNRRSSGWDMKDDYFGKRIERSSGWDSRNPPLAKTMEDIGRPKDMRHRDRLVGWKKHAVTSERPDNSNQTIPEQDIVPDLPEDSAEFKQQVERNFLKYSKTLNEDPEQRRKYEKEGKAGMLPCLACGR